MADDDDRDERDENEEDEEEEEVEKKPAPKKAEAKPVKTAASATAQGGGGDVQSELKKIRVLLEESREYQKQYLWLLFPIIAILLIQTIMDATRL